MRGYLWNQQRMYGVLQPLCLGHPKIESVLFYGIRFRQMKKRKIVESNLPKGSIFCPLIRHIKQPGIYLVVIVFCIITSIDTCNIHFKRDIGVHKDIL